MPTPRPPYIQTIATSVLPTLLGAPFLGDPSSGVNASGTGSGRGSDTGSLTIDHQKRGIRKWPLYCSAPGSRFPITLAGMPPTTSSSATSLLATDCAATTAPR